MSAVDDAIMSKFEQLIWIGGCVASKEGNILWTFAEGDRCIVKWKISTFE